VELPQRNCRSGTEQRTLLQSGTLRRAVYNEDIEILHFLRIDGDSSPTGIPIPILNIKKMKKDTINLIFEESKIFFLSKGFKLQKNPQRGVVFTKKTNNLILSGIFGFYDDIYPKIQYDGTISISCRMFELEDLYKKIYLDNQCTLPNNSITWAWFDIEWRDMNLRNWIDSEDREAVISFTKSILKRFETHVQPIIEKYQTVEDLAELYKNDPIQFKNIVMDSDNLKYLLILKLSKSDLFKDEFEKKDSFLKKWFEENPNYKEKDTSYNIFKEIEKL
jgi:hypothetical protein